MIGAISPWSKITRPMRVAGTEDTFNFTILVHSTYNHLLTSHISSNHHHPPPLILQTIITDALSSLRQT
jgi:hypothetical protein